MCFKSPSREYKYRNSLTFAMYNRSLAVRKIRNRKGERFQASDRTRRTVLHTSLVKALCLPKTEFQLKAESRI